ncbi:MAG: pseudaminic acid synthase [Bacteroidota bacterium]
MTIDIAGRKIGQGQPCFIIAELSANHNGSLDTAIATIRAAKRTGADAIKIQTYTADTITLDLDTEDFQIKGTIWDGQTFHSLYKKAYTPFEWHPELFRVAREEGLICFSSPFDFTAVDLLASLDAPAYKIASLEITDIPLIRYAASQGKPMIMSTGIATEEDIDLALATCREAGNEAVALLKCTTAYPAPVEEANLAMIPEFRRRYGVVPGLSDHTLGAAVPVAAAVLGANVIEKHFILDKSLGGPDVSFSLDEAEFTEMVRTVRAAEAAIGVVDFTPTEKMKSSRALSRSLYITADVRKGDVLSPENVRSVRPGHGMHPKHYDEVLGKRFNGDFVKGTRLSWDCIEG